MRPRAVEPAVGALDLNLSVANPTVGVRWTWDQEAPPMDRAQPPAWTGAARETHGKPRLPLHHCSKATGARPGGLQGLRVRSTPMRMAQVSLTTCFSTVGTRRVRLMLGMRFSITRTGISRTRTPAR